MVADIHGKPLLERLIDRLKLAKRADCIILATTCLPADTELADMARAHGLLVYRGSSEDVIERMLGATLTYELDFTIIAEGDELFCDAEYIDQAIEVAEATGADCVKTKDLPIGSWVVGVRREALEEVYQAKGDESTEAFARFFTEDSKYKTSWLPPGEGIPPFNPRLRLTIDYPEDLQLAREIYGRLELGGRSTRLMDVMSLFEQDPDLIEVNAFRNDEYYARVKERTSKSTSELANEKRGQQ
jgi:spore coat polysaccharide biosynthesis protein SpsF